jgi:hypothetical protein
MDLYYEQGFNQNMGWRFEFFWFNWHEVFLVWCSFAWKNEWVKCQL